MRTWHRVAVLTATLLTAASAGCGVSEPVAPPASAVVTASSSASVLQARFGQLEARFGARLGVFAVDTGTGRTVAHRADERFPYASTYKALAAAAVLARSTPEEMETIVRYHETDLVEYSPVTQQHVEQGMSLSDIAAAAVTRSDNTAGNLLLERLGGPEGFQDVLRDLGDQQTDPARNEPALNAGTPGDPRDTSTPRALAGDVRAYTVGDALGVADRTILNEWLRTNTTGAELIRAGVPAGWDVGDKTGAGRYGTRNDIAVLRPPGRAPIVLAVLSTRYEEAAEFDNALIAEAARAALAAVVGQP